MNNIQKKTLLLGIITELTAIALTGCNDSYTIKRGELKIVYEQDNTINGTISYADVENYIKIITIKQKEFTKKMLVIKILEQHPTRSFRYTLFKYIQIISGTEILTYKFEGLLKEEEIKDKNPKTILLGEDIQLLEEESLTNYLIQEDKIQREYDINELITFFNEHVNNTVETKKENVKRKI